MIEESNLSYVAASITVLYIRLLIALIGQNKKRYKKCFIAQKHYNTKSSNRERHKSVHALPVRRMMRLKQHGVTAHSSE